LARYRRPGGARTDDRMVMDKVAVRSPATLSNLGSGFDVFGLALREPYDVIEARRIREMEVVIESIEGRGAETITTEPSSNSAGAAAKAVLERAGADCGVALRIKKGIRPSSGIGSSGSSAAGGAYATNLILDKPLRPEELVVCAARAEEITSGSFHADNVGPAVLGGFTLIRSYDPFEVHKMEPPANLGVVVTMPEFLVSTREARKVLPKTVDLRNMVYEVGNASALVLGMSRGDVDLIGRSMGDRVIEPARAPLNPHLGEAEVAAREAGAAGAFLGGSGPCVIAIYDRKKVDGEEIAAAVRGVYRQHDVQSDQWVTTWGEGCRRL
jgi:homoserine kinase